MLLHARENKVKGEERGGGDGGRLVWGDAQKRDVQSTKPDQTRRKTRERKGKRRDREIERRRAVQERREELTSGQADA